VFKHPTPLSDALAQVSSWISSPTAQLLGETPGYFPILHSVLQSGLVIGPRIHDARLVAICLANRVTTLCSADRDFSRFSTSLSIVNPLAR
jgi:hypothetical protein